MNSALVLRRVNGWLTVVWAIAAIPIVLFWRESVTAVVLISVYANIAGHLSAWQAARVEVHQADDADVREVLDAIEAKD